ncbi:hypothetical protein JAAARDRAFT_41800 [Jaapia argillacea MUCL 33604]|uniref:MYND-type domain-containing protein n=1 Tax=Jaapia argillacea MUCL 33604 TaxID=933084 RepID=A0A067PI50_9AGAM|nr:hypothetical protein JAAARDRAFT_41800 [Jaapia argillacea MUCL 33604]
MNPPLCKVCLQPTSTWCSRCEQAFYCSPAHSQADWPRHRRECVPVSQNTIATPPLYQQPLVTVSAILFQPELERPRIVTVNCQPLSAPSPHGSCPIPMLRDFFPDSPNPSHVVLTAGLNNEPLRFPLHLFYCPNSLNRGSPVNRAIHRITSGAAPKAWCGPVVVLKFNGSRRQGYGDAGNNDLPALSTYFLAYQ